MKVNNTDVIGDKCVKDKDNNLVLGDKEKLRVWKAHFKQLLNVDFNWDDSSLYIEAKHVAQGKACSPCGIVIEMVKARGDAMLEVITDMINLIIKEEQIPNNWEYSTIINCSNQVW